MSTRKTVLLLSALLLIASGCMSASSSIRWASPHQPRGKHFQLYRDGSYQFVTVNFGHGGGQTPGFHVYSLSKQKWLRITEVSVENAKLGRSPTHEELKTRGLFPGPALAWNFAQQYGGRKYIPLPMRTSGSIAFADTIEYDESRRVYVLLSGSSWGIESATKLEIRKQDLDEAFAKQ